MPETVEDDCEKSDGTPSEDLESAVPLDSSKGAIRFGWIRGVLVSLGAEALNLFTFLL